MLEKMAFDFGFRSGNFAFRYSDRPFYDFFHFGSWEEIIVLLLVFVIGFIFSYLSLKKFFEEEIPAGYYPTKSGATVYKKASKGIKNKNAFLILNLCIAALMAIGLARINWMFYYLGDVAGIVALAIVGVLFMVLMYGVFEFLEKSIGSTVVSAIMLAVILWFSTSLIIANNAITSKLPSSVATWVESVGLVWIVLAMTLLLVLASKFRRRKNWTRGGVF